MDDRKDYGPIPSLGSRHLPASQTDFYEPLPHSPASSSVSRPSFANHNDCPDDPDNPKPDHRSSSSMTHRSVSTTIPSLSKSISIEDPLLVTSPLLRHNDKSYIKLEVISANEARSLLVFFNWFIIAAFLYTILLLIAANTAHESTQLMAFLPQYLTEKQKHRATLIPKTPAARALTRTFFHSTADPQFRPPSSHAIFSSECHPPCTALHPPDAPVSASTASQRHPLTFGPRSTSIRQQPAQPAAVDEDVPEAPPDGVEGGPSDDLIGEGALPGPQYSDDLNPDDFLFFIPERISVLPRAYKLVSHFSNLFLAVFFFVLSILFAIRVFSEGKRRTTHEQIWVLVLMLSTSLYFSAFESIIRVFEELNKEVHKRFEPWVFRIEDVFTVLREASFAVVTFFYIWANLHSYRILDPLKRLTFRGFYLPKLMILAPLTVFMAISYTVIPVLLTEIPLFAAPVFVFLFSEFKIIPALRAELLASVIKSIYDMILLSIIVFEARKTLEVLEKAPYMKHRTKRVGFRFFVHINSVFYVLFFILQFMLMFGKPTGDNLVTLGPSAAIVHTGLFHFWTVGPNILLTGYVLVTAYVHLPRTSIGVFGGGFHASKRRPLRAINV